MWWCGWLDTSSWSEDIASGPGSGPLTCLAGDLPSLTPATREKIRSLTAALALPECEDDLEALRAIATEIASGFAGGELEKAIRLEQQRSSGSSGEKVEKEGLTADGYPLGIATPDDKVREFGTVARLLYVARMHEVQRVFNEVLAECQEYTADAKTDGSLGKVGY